MCYIETLMGIGNMATVEPSRELDELSSGQVVLVRQHLKEVLASHAFAGSQRAQDFLQLIVGHALEGQIDSLRERMIGAEMFGRPVGYDTGSDSVVRVKATEVRKKLAQYYLEEVVKPAIRIELPAGHYVPRFHFDPSKTAAQAPAEAVPSNSTDQPIGKVEVGSGDKVETGADKAPPFILQGVFRSPRILAGIVLGLVVVTASGYAAFRKWFGDSHARTEIHSIAILPLKNLSGDPGQEYFADGMTEELINDLGQVSTLRVISLTSAMSYKGTTKKLPEIARELSVDGVVEGAVQREGNQVRISAQLIDARTDRPIWAHTYVRDMTSVLSLQAEVTQAISDEVSFNENPQRQARLASLRPVNTESEDLYLQGMSVMNAGDFKSAIGYFQKAINADPSSARAHAALAGSFGWMGESGQLAYAEAFPKQKAEAIKAIGLDDSLPAGHVELANAAMNLDWDWTTAEKEFHRALELNPSSASVHQRYAVYLERIGKLPEAIAEVERGAELDPVSALSLRDAGFTYYFSRQYDQALALARRAHALNIKLRDYTFLLGDIYVEKGMYAKSIAEFQKLGDSPHDLGHLGNAYARAGQTNEARGIILELEQHVQSDGVGGYEIALVYAGLGEKSKAFMWLESSYKAHNEGLTNLKIDPCLDPLRSDPRFPTVVRRVGLPQ
ncbi:MAG TPA: tetratricopeptide repeat protein [Terracidiphilus sp.]|nr:tetratricopeptide repeat protein [Terracidiphilus sp.]